MSKKFHASLNELKIEFNKLVEENKLLKGKLELLENSPDLNNYRELLTDKNIVLNSSEKIISKIVGNLRNNLNLKCINKNALVIFAIDNSGSMGSWEKYIGKCFTLWIKKLLEEIHEDISFKFIVHHTQANEVTEEEYNKAGESGGTIVSSAYKKINLLIEEENYLNDKDVYVFHISDGDNLSSDNKICNILVDKIKYKSKLFSYLEINPYIRRSTLINSVFRDKDYINSYIIRQKNDVYDAIKYVFNNLK